MMTARIDYLRAVSGSKKKVLALGMVVAGMMAASLLMAASPAHASTTFVVNSSGDSPDASTDVAACDVDKFTSGDQCTLRAAIQQANATGGADTISFNIPGTGVHTISPNSPLPDIDESLTIDGYSQPGSSPNTLTKGTNAKLMIELNGAESSINHSPQEGLSIEDSNVLIKGLVINGFTNPNPNGSSSDAIGVFPDSMGGLVTNVSIEGNFIGTDPSGTQAVSNGNGIFIFNTSNNKIGGDSPAKRNIISGNNFSGVFIDGESSAPFGPASNNRVVGNLIGTTKDGLTALGNAEHGVGTLGDVAKGNSILSNSIFSNGRLGIQLSSNLQNSPVLSSAKSGKRGTTIVGQLDSTPNSTFTLQFFSNPSGTDEGRTLVGQKSVATDTSGSVSFSFKSKKKVGKGQNITATATNDSTGDTSEFSAPAKVG
jgi:CSLREA domain-containing protein